jgi:DNA-binding CsgD family transcriptional regulator
LSKREREVVERLRFGKTYKTISYELRIKEGTARVLGARALRKLGTNAMTLRYRAWVEQTSGEGQT